MYLPTSFAILVALWSAASVSAVALPDAQPGVAVGDHVDGLKVIEVENLPTGTVVWYGDIDQSGTQAEAAKPTPTCGLNFIDCTNGPYKANATNCENLIVALSHQGQRVPQHPRSVCYNNFEGPQCCVSWADPVPGRLVYYDFVPAANKTMINCNSGGYTVGLARNVSLAGTCTTQCLSSVPNACPNRN